MPPSPSTTQAHELVIVLEAGVAPQITFRKVDRPAPPGLPIFDPDHPVPIPTFRLEVVQAIPPLAPWVGDLLYRRAYARPLHVEALGADLEWTPLPAGHRQVLVTSVPYFDNEQWIFAIAYEVPPVALAPPALPPPSTPWFQVQLQ